MKFYASVIIFACFTYFGTITTEGVNESCTFRHNGNPGICKYDKNCPSLIPNIKKGIRPTICGFEGTSSVVCCDTPKPKPKPTMPVGQKSKEYCDENSGRVTTSFSAFVLLPDAEAFTINVTKCEYNRVPLITGGQPAEPGEFPHMVALGYINDRAEMTWTCGGTLISDRYILTAGHCSRQPIEFARLGDLNLLEDEDIDDYEFNPITITIESVIKHPDYKPRLGKYNDIALAKLSKSVEFTKFIRPACLWTKFSIDQSKTIATGYGDTKNSSISRYHLRKAVLDVVPQTNCEKGRFLKILKREGLPEGIQNTNLCAGDIGGKKDTCQGDSGGPLVISDVVNPCIFHLVGVTSFGVQCAQGVPSIFTRVSEYIGWIEPIVWPA